MSKSRALSRITSDTVLLKTGLARSNALRGTIFTVPASAEPCDSGVGENDTSMRAILLIDAMSTCAARPVLLSPPVLARLKPSIVIGTYAGGTPLSEMPRA